MMTIVNESSDELTSLLLSQNENKMLVIMVLIEKREILRFK